MILYAESSAVLAWLLGEASQSAILRELTRAERVVSSSLTAVECARGLARARASRRLKASEELAALHLLDAAESSWDVLDLSELIMTRARGTFPAEPVRTLDALHLATALAFHEALGSVTVLSFDTRIRRNASELGMFAAPRVV